MNFVGMTAGSAALLVAAVLASERLALPVEDKTQLAVAYLVFATVALFLLVLVLVQRWTASSTAYTFVSMPVVAVALGALVADERITVTTVLGGTIVFAGCIWEHSHGAFRLARRGSSLQRERMDVNVKDEAIKRLRAAARRLDDVADRAERGEAKREDVDLGVAEVLGAQRDLFGPRPRAARGEGARQKILTYLKAHVGEEVSGEELAAASGIHEWARRLRELRVEHGYAITEVGDSVYRMEGAEPDIERARRWAAANTIRRFDGSAMDRIEAFLKSFEGEVVSRDQIDYVAKIKEGSRRVRELRDEHGWPINSHIDEPDLMPGEYRLVSADPADRRDPRQRLYSEGLRERIFARDDYTCRECGRNREQALAAGDTRFYLEVHHQTAVAEQLDALSPDELNNDANLVTLCHADHAKETAAFHERRRRER